MLAERLESQALSGDRLASPEVVVKQILAVQAQDPRGFRLAVRSRLDDEARQEGASGIDRLISKERSLVVSWLNRGTLHLVGADDYVWLHAITAPRQITGNWTRLKQEGVSEAAAERGVEVITAALADRGPLKRSELRGLLDSADVPTAGQALVHLLLLASLRNLVMRGPVDRSEQAFVLVEDWLGPLPEVNPETALAELARRYLTGHSPASDRDLAKWTGITIGQARAGLKAIGSEVHERPDGLLELFKTADAAGSTPKLPTRLLGAFDPVLHGWTSRDFLIPSESGRQVVTTNGIFRPTMMVEGRIKGIWAMPGGEVEMKPFDGQSDAVETLNQDGDQVLAYLGS